MAGVIWQFLSYLDGLGISREKRHQESLSQKELFKREIKLIALAICCFMGLFVAFAQWILR